MADAGLMQTQAGDPGAFRRFDLRRVPSPCFVVDEVAIERNLRVLRDVADASGVQILAALKAFSMFSVAPLVSRYMDGVCASGLFEAQLGREEYGGEVATFCAGYKADEFDRILALSNTIIFNSPAQKDRFLPRIRQSGRAVSIGLRINPEHSEGEVAKYDPAAPCSRLGFPVSQLKPEMLEGVDGLHMHSLCEQGFEPLDRTWSAIAPRIASMLAQVKWFNFGGGHHITRADYDRDGLCAFLRRLKRDTGLQFYLEPGEAVALDAGILVGEVLDLGQNDINIAIVDISATCHMPDVIEAPYRPAMLNEAESGETYRLGGPSCLAGDVIGDYTFSMPPKVGQRFAFLDQAHYSMVKTNTFNGVPLPSIALWNSASDDLRIVRAFGYEDFKARLS